MADCRHTHQALELVAQLNDEEVYELLLKVYATHGLVSFISASDKLTGLLDGVVDGSQHAVWAFALDSCHDCQSAVAVKLQARVAGKTIQLIVPDR